MIEGEVVKTELEKRMIESGMTVKVKVETKLLYMSMADRSVVETLLMEIRGEEMVMETSYVETS